MLNFDNISDIEEYYESVNPVEPQPIWYTNLQYQMDDIFSPIREIILWWFCCNDYSPMAQVIIAFVYGLLLSPWSYGLFFLTCTIISLELLYFIFTKGNPKYYNLFVRLGVICSSISGFIIGRTFSLNIDEAIK